MNQQQFFRILDTLLRHRGRGNRSRWVLVLAGAILFYSYLQPVLQRQLGWHLPTSPPATSTRRIDRETLGEGEAAVLTAFKGRKSDVFVEGTAVVKKLLKDDLVGDRHQKMILTLSSGHTVLLAHNIDLAPRVPAGEGDLIRFRGEYEYSDQGGVIHWTHHDPGGRHRPGWLEFDGKKYE